MDCFEKAKYTRAIKGLEKYKELIADKLSLIDNNNLDDIIAKLKETRDFEEKQKCAAEDCSRLFVPYKSGRLEQIYCSKNCKMREYRRRQKKK